MTATCTCYPADWFVHDQTVMITIFCKVHGEGPEALGPTEPPKVVMEVSNDQKN